MENIFEHIKGLKPLNPKQKRAVLNFGKEMRDIIIPKLLEKRGWKSTDKNNENKDTSGNEFNHR